MSKDPSSKIDVLYVEDAIDEAHLVKSFFNSLPGFDVHHSQDGDHALELVASREWDLIVVDLNLPGTDGFAVIRAARGRSSVVPILVTTGYTQAQYEEQALRAGANQVMIKPLSQNDFVSRVWSMVEGAERTAEDGDEETIVVVEGRLGDGEMAAGGSLKMAADDGIQVLVVPLLPRRHEDLPAELKAAEIAANILGAKLQMELGLVGEPDAQKDYLARTIEALRPRTLYIPSVDDRDLARKEAHLMGLAAGASVENIYAYETATTGLEFSPTMFVDVRSEMVFKMEALAAYQSMGAPRHDLRPTMAQAYARYWGRFKDFTEVEAFESVRR